MCFAYEVSRNAAIILRMSTSLCIVSSNPGVSIKTTRRPSRLKGFPGCTTLVEDSSPIPTRMLDPLTRLINCVTTGREAHGKLFQVICINNPETDHRKESDVQWTSRFPWDP